MPGRDGTGPFGMGGQTGMRQGNGRVFFGFGHQETGIPSPKQWMCLGLGCRNGGRIWFSPQNNVDTQ